MPTQLWLGTKAALVLVMLEMVKIEPVLFLSVTVLAALGVLSGSLEKFSEPGVTVSLP